MSLQHCISLSCLADTVITSHLLCNASEQTEEWTKEQKEWREPERDSIPPCFINERVIKTEYFTCPERNRVTLITKELSV